MKTYFIKNNTTKLIIVFISVIIVASVIIISLLNKWESNVIEKNRLLTDLMVKKLSKTAQKTIDSLYTSGYFNQGLSEIELNTTDKKLSAVTKKILKTTEGIEGGFYFLVFKKFQGYSYPTSPPPVPAYGPPPRSYAMIEKQVQQSIKSNMLITELHGFNPAIFPLSTISIKYKGKTIGAAWVRIHIEKELPNIKIQSLINISAVLAIIGFLTALYFSIRQKYSMDKIRNGLHIVQKDTSYRLEKLPGVYGHIANSVNTMVDALNEKHEKVIKLEKDVFQQEKMASLGKLIAGVVHDVKTPLAIIKTRVQMWQRELQKNSDQNGILFNDESINLVTNEIDRLTKLINKLLVFSKPITYEMISANINSILNSVVLLYNNSSKYIFSLSLDERIPSLYLNPDGIKQVFTNLLTNAMEAMPNGGEIQITSKYSDRKIEITISDKGCGIEDVNLNNVFDPFYTTKDLGTGLGLSIAYEIIKAHKGEIFFSKNLNNGVICTINFPVK